MTGWVPILLPSTKAAKQAWEAIDAISEAVLTQSPPSPGRASFLNDEPLLYGYLALVRDEEFWFDRTAEHLNQAIDRASELKHLFGLHSGLCGLGWVVEHLSRLFNETSANEATQRALESESDTDNDVNADIDNQLLRQLENGPWLGPYDLINGLVGFGVYFLERIPVKNAIRGIKLVIKHLDELAVRTDTGVAWYSSPETLPKWQQDLCPDGYYNLGVAHGIPSVIYFLSEVSAAGIGDERSEALLEGAMQWLMAHERPPASISRFGPWVSGGKSSDCRLGWCYGDPGIAAVLLQVARRTGRIDWRTYGWSLLEHCLDRPINMSWIEDASLCHGACGLAQIYNRIYQSEGARSCRDAAISWFERALAMRRPGTGVGGILSFIGPSPEEPGCWDPNPALIDGAIGVALALLSAVTSQEPGWDRMFLLSGRRFLNGQS